MSTDLFFTSFQNGLESLNFGGKTRFQSIYPMTLAIKTRKYVIRKLFQNMYINDLVLSISRVIRGTKNVKIIDIKTAGLSD